MPNKQARQYVGITPNGVLGTETSMYGSDANMDISATLRNIPHFHISSYMYMS